MFPTDLTFSQALLSVINEVRPTEPEEVPLLSAHNRFLAGDVISTCDVPAFDNSAMDGYAVRSADTAAASKENPVTLKVLEEVPAGSVPEKAVIPGTATRIMTGSPMPEGADAVIRQEAAIAADGEITILEQMPEGFDRRKKGEDIEKGGLVLPKGTRITGACMGLLASVGADPVRVARRPIVAILSTGSELVDVREEPPPGAVRASNAYALTGEILAAGGVPLEGVTAPDTVPDVAGKLKEVDPAADVIITTGGASVGKYDHINEAILRAGGDIVFTKVLMRPGSPFTLGRLDGRVVFALSGNPAAAMLCFEVFVRPALLAMQGARVLKRPEVRAVLAADLNKRPGFMHLVRARVRYNDGRYEAEPLTRQGSGQQSSLAAADGIITVPMNRPNIAKGEEVTVRMLNRE
jgi:molybdopterin molybdotransferase